MYSMFSRTVIAAALSLGMIGVAQGQDAVRADGKKVAQGQEAVRADGKKVAQVQRVLERNPELRKTVFSALEARDGPELERSLAQAGILKMFEDPAGLAAALCLMDGVPMPSHVCNRFIAHDMHDWAAF